MVVKDDAAIDNETLKYYYDKGYAEGYGAARIEGERTINWWREIVEQLRSDNDELRTELQQARRSVYGYE